MRLVDGLWLGRFILAFPMAFIAAYLSFIGIFGETTAYLVFTLAVVAYILSYLAARFFFRISPLHLPKKTDIWLTGLLPFLLTWFAFWIFFFTLLKSTM